MTEAKTGENPSSIHRKDALAKDLQREVKERGLKPDEVVAEFMALKVSKHYENWAHESEWWHPKRVKMGNREMILIAGREIIITKTKEAITSPRFGIEAMRFALDNAVQFYGAHDFREQLFLAAYPHLEKGPGVLGVTFLILNGNQVRDLKQLL